MLYIQVEILVHVNVILFTGIVRNVLLHI